LANWTAPGAPKPRAQTPDPAENSLVLTPASGRIEDCRFGMAGVWLRLITQVADDNRDTSHTSSPRAVAYQLVRHNLSNTGGATVRYSLFRSEVRAMGSRSTFAVGYDLFAAEYNDAAAGGTSLADAGTLRRPRRDQLLANNVIDFGVRFYARDVSSALICLFPRDSGNLGFAASVRDGRTSLAPAWGGNPALPPAGSSSHAYAPGEMSYGYPVVAEVAVRILSEDGAREIAALERGDLTGRGWWATALPMSRVFTRRIEIGAAPL
jgi:hypothetical protein